MRSASAVSSENLSQHSLLAFCRATFPNYLTSEHLARVAAHLTALNDGAIRRLIVTLPPRHGKSELCSIRFPAWLLGRNPDNRYVIASYGQDLATRFSREVRAVVREEMYQRIFPDVVLAEDSKSVNAWDIANHRGGLRAVGVGGALTGYGATGILIDDPVKSRAEADSDLYRENVWQWYRSVVYTRLEPGGWIALIMTRWHEDDLAGRILRQVELDPLADRWTVLHLPAISDTNEALWPERYNLEQLRTIEANVGPREWEALYQGRPRAAEGALFKQHWFRVEDRAPTNLRWCRFWDLAASTRTSADYTASAACAISAEGVLYVRDIIHGRWEWPDARRIIMETARGEPGVEVGIETVGFQLAAVQDLLREPALRSTAIRGIDIDKDKIARALPWAARAELGKLVLISGPWVQPFISECLSFPVGAHDDRVDAVSGAMMMLAKHRQVEYGPAIW